MSYYKTLSGKWDFGLLLQISLLKNDYRENSKYQWAFHGYRQEPSSNLYKYKRYNFISESNKLLRDLANNICSSHCLLLKPSSQCSATLVWSVLLLLRCIVVDNDGFRILVLAWDQRSALWRNEYNVERTWVVENIHSWWLSTYLWQRPTYHKQSCLDISFSDSAAVQKRREEKDSYIAPWVIRYLHSISPNLIT